MILEFGGVLAIDPLHSLGISTSLRDLPPITFTCSSCGEEFERVCDGCGRCRDCHGGKKDSPTRSTTSLLGITDDLDALGDDDDAVAALLFEVIGDSNARSIHAVRMLVPDRLGELILNLIRASGTEQSPVEFVRSMPKEDMTAYTLIIDYFVANNYHN